MPKLRKLQVIYAGWGERWLLGTLADDGCQTLFEYSAEARAEGLELSPLKLPLTAPQAHRGEAYFLGLPRLVDYHVQTQLIRIISAGDNHPHQKAQTQPHPDPGQFKSHCSTTSLRPI